jgi:Methylase involved in ubiquinone/menaquinone biosynthesis
VRAAGVDLSLAAVKRAAKKDRGLFFAVASVFELPLAEESTDVLLSIFAPINEFGFKRVLKRGGRLIIAAPGKRHLFGLKEVLYENPYENEENLFQFDGFEYKKSHFVKREIYLENTSDVMNLFMMTPYYWKTSQNGVKRLGELKELNTTIEFEFIDLERK